MVALELFHSTTTTLALYLHDHKNITVLQKHNNNNNNNNNNNYNKKSLNKTNQIISDQEFNNNLSLICHSFVILKSTCIFPCKPR